MAQVVGLARVTPEDLAACTGASLSRAQRFAPALSAAMAFYSIDTPARQAAFLAQLGHESGGMRWLSEIWGPTPAQERYEGREDLGNTQPGDGSRFRGRGVIQTTGRANYAKVRDRLRERFADVPDFEAEPEQLAELPWCCLSAADYWDMHNLNALADAGNFRLITKRINGGTNGLADRLARWEAAKTTLEV
jgi:putative chitinase